MGLFQPVVQESSSRERLEELLRAVHRPDTSRIDPQLERLNGMLDKIMRIQHPTVGTTDPIKPALGLGTMRLEQPVAENPVKDLAVDNGTKGGGFYGLDGDEAEDTLAAGNAFPAMIPESQVLVAGATIALRLLEPAVIGRVTVPADELLYGKASLSGDRLLVNINSIRVGSSVYSVALQVYDLDGMAGIHVPGAITRDVLKQSAAEGVNGLGVVTTDGSLGAQAAEAGIETARTLFSRKIGLVRVTVPAGYRVLLRNQSLNNH
jgi:conjugative transposon TraM protein